MGIRCSCVWLKPRPPPAYDAVAATPSDVIVEEVIRMIKRSKHVSTDMIELAFEALRVNGVLRYNGPPKITYTRASAIILGVIEGYVPEHGQCVADYDPIQHRLRWLPGWPLPSPLRTIADFRFRNIGKPNTEEFLGQLLATHSTTPVKSKIPKLWCEALATDIANHCHSSETYSIIENQAGGYSVTFQ
jgi:hypothetical protein